MPASTIPIRVVGTRMYGVLRRYRLAASPTMSSRTPPPTAMIGSWRREIPKVSIASTTSNTDCIVFVDSETSSVMMWVSTPWVTKYSRIRWP